MSARRHPIVELTLARVREFLREPEATFWVFAFPILLAGALGLAFRSKAPEALPVAVEAGAAAEARRAALASDPGLAPSIVPTAEARAAIEEGIAKIVAGGGRPLALGGDHSVTYPILRGLNPSRAPLAILHVDAHGDLYDVFEGDRYSHACPFARILEEGLASRLVQVGIRAQTPHQRDQAARFGVEVIDMRAWVAGRRPEIAGPVYVSIDLDGLDPSAAPGVSHREPGGLTVREVLTLLQALAGPIVGGDVVELNPHRDLDRVTARVGAKLARELAAAMLRTAEIGTPS
jgi:agmatinase